MKIIKSKINNKIDDNSDDIPQINFGSDDGSSVDWRKVKDGFFDIDDDELLEKTPQDVIDLTGIDPLDWDKENNDTEKQTIKIKTGDCKMRIVKVKIEDKKPVKK